MTAGVCFRNPKPRRFDATLRRTPSPTPRQTPLPLRPPPSSAQESPPLMPLLDLLPPERVRTHLVAADKPALIAELAEILAADDDVGIVRKALESREQLGSTGLGHGVAIPHGRCADVSEPRAAFVRLAKPIDFGADDRQPVDLVAG